MLFRIQADAPLIEVAVDLLGDGMPGTTVMGSDLRAVGALWFQPQRAGRYQLQVRAVDDCGRTDATGAAREVVVW